jgi:Cysteine-rich CPCC
MSAYPCPACGFLVFGEPPGSYEICDVCDWEDDHVQLTHPTMRGGANAESLFEAQRRALALVPLELRTHGDLTRASAWRPLQIGDPGLDNASDSPSDGRGYFEAAAGDAVPYYWQVSSPRMVESILADVDVRAPGKSDFSLWIPEQLSFKNELVPQDLAMALVLDRLLGHGLFPAGFEQHSGGRVYHYNSAG